MDDFSCIPAADLAVGIFHALRDRKMRARTEIRERKCAMTCYVCGAAMAHILSLVPFKTSSAVVILKNTPLWQCTNCREYLIDDNVMGKIDEIVKGWDPSIEIGIVRFDQDRQESSVGIG